jgi:hypothetical protein
MTCQYYTVEKQASLITRFFRHPPRLTERPHATRMAPVPWLPQDG